MGTDYRDFYTNKQVLITGGLGFLGSNLAHDLVKLGAQVLLFDALLPVYGGNPANISELHGQVQVNIADIRDEAAINALVRDKDVIFHIGNQTSHVDSMTDPLLDVDINCRGNIIFLEACRKHNPEAKIVYAGTRGQYGRLEHLPVDEQHRMNPTDIYGVNKNAGEQYHFIYHKAFGLRTTSLRINNSYGPRHQMKHGKYGILNWFIRLAMDNGTIKIFGDGSQLRDYNYVDDVSDAFLRVGSSEATTGEAYNLGSGEQIRFADLVQMILETVGSGKVEYVPWPKDRKDIEVGDYVADVRKIKQAAGWEPLIQLKDGLPRTVEFYRGKEHLYWQ